MEAENSAKKTHPVGSKLPNACRLYDVHGSVCEWLRTDLGVMYDPTAPASGVPQDDAEAAEVVPLGGVPIRGVAESAQYNLGVMYELTRPHHPFSAGQWSI